MEKKNCERVRFWHFFQLLVLAILAQAPFFSASGLSNFGAGAIFGGFVFFHPIPYTCM
jgi:hypothetical protein